MNEAVARGGGHSAGRTKVPVSVPFVLAAAILVGIGLFLTVLWLALFQWVYFTGIFLLVLGGLLLFHPKAGLDR